MDQIVKKDSSSHPSRMRAKASQLLQDIDLEQLPGLPNILLSLLKKSHHPKSPAQLANDINKDPGLRIRLLSICQHHGNTGNESTAEILQQLDEHTLRNLVITTAAQQYFSEQATPEQTRFLKQHWQHSVLCAAIAKLTAQQCQYQYPEEAYTAGLLHDIGELVLHCAYPDIYTTLNMDKDDNIALQDLEQNEFACNHLYLGAELLKSYKSSSFLCDSILYHHEPVEDIMDAHALVKIINFSNLLSNTDFNKQGEDKNGDIFKHAEQLFGFSRAKVIEIIGSANTHLNNCIVEFEIDIDEADDDEENTRQIQARANTVQAQLGEQIKYISLLDGLHQQISRIDKEDDIFNAIEQYSHLLFGIDQHIIFLYDMDTKQLLATSARGNQHLLDFKIPLKEKRSIVADCLLKKEPLHSFAHHYSKLSVVDQQLLSATEKSGIICLPLINDDDIIGALIFAVERQQQATLWKQLPLLKHFSREIAHTLQCRRARKKSDPPDWGEFQKHTREVIHEVNNPLSIINNYLGILSLKLDKDNQASTDIQTIKSEIGRVSEILQRLKSTDSITKNIEKTDINTLLTELSQIFQSSILANHDIQLKLDLDSELLPVLCNANALKQVYTNLIKNSVEALSEKSEIMVYTQDQVNVDGQTYVEISVVDNGPGIRPAVLNQLFKPVQTEKGNDHAGIGLSIVKKLVTEMNGSISCRSNKKGTRFQILLPNK